MRIPILFLLICSLPAWSFQADKEAVQTGPKLTFESLKQDLGSLRKGEVKTVEFKFVNTGDATLEIENIQADCGCTTPKLSQRIYAPGEAGVLPVTLNTLNLDGEIHKNVYVYSNDKAGKKVQLHLDGQIYSPVEVTPENVALNRVPRTGVTEGTLKVSTTMMDKLEIANPRANLPFIQLNAERVDDQSFDLHFSFKGEDVPQDAERLTGIISVDTNSPDQPNITARLILRMLKVVEFKPRLVVFLGNDTEPKTIEVSGQDPDANIEIQSVESDTPAVKAVQSTDSPNQVVVTLAEDAPVGSFAARITIHTNSLEQPYVVVPVRVRR